MTTVYLHIGLHRTASSSIQHSLYWGRDTLRKANVLYPDLGSANHSFPIYTLFADPGAVRSSVFGRRPPPRSVQGGIRQARASVRQTKEHLRSAIEGGYFDKVVLSGEGLSALTASELEALRSFLRTWSDDVIVVVYLRHPSPVASGLTALQVLMGELFPESAAETPAPYYRLHLEPFLQTFGRGRIIFRPFPPGPDTSVDAVKDFLTTIGCPELDEMMPRVTANRSLLDTQVRILERYNRIVPQWVGPDRQSKNPERGREDIGCWLGSFESPTFRFERPFRRAVAAINQEDQAWVEGVAGFELPPDPKHDQPGPERTDPELYDELVARLRELSGAYARGDGKGARQAARAIIQTVPPDCEIGGRVREVAGTE